MAPLSVVYDAGSVIGAVGLKRIEAESDIQIAKAQGMMEDTMAKFQEWRGKNSDQSQWGPELQRRLDEAKTQIFEKTKLHNAAYNQILPQFTRYASKAATDVELAATKATFAQAKDVYLTRMNRAIATQNHGELKATAKEGLAKSYLYPHEVAEGARAFGEEGARQQKAAQNSQDRAEHQRIDNEIKADPAAFIASQTPPKEGSKDQYYRRIEYANYVLRSQRAAGIHDAVNQIAERSIMIPGDVDEKAKNVRSEKTMADLKAYVLDRDIPKSDGKKPGDDPIYRRIELENRIDEIKPEKDEDMRLFARYAWEIRKSVDPDDQPEVLRKLYRAYNVQAPAMREGPAWKQQIANIATKRYDRRDGVYAWDKYEDYEFGGKYSRERRLDLEMEKRNINARAAFERNLRANATNDARLREPAALDRAEKEYNPPEEAAYVLQRIAEAKQRKGAMVSGVAVPVSTPPSDERVSALQKLQPKNSQPTQ